MATLTNLSPSSSFGGLLNLLNTSGLSPVLQVIQDGFGNNSTLSLSTTDLNINTTMGGFFIDGIELEATASELNAASIADFSGFSDSLNLPAGTTAQRPAVPISGTIRYNNQTLVWEGFSNGLWRTFQTVP